MDASKVIEGQLEIELAPAEAQSTAKSRVDMSLPHLLSAAVLCRRVGELEAAHSGKELGEFWDDILANASGAVFASIASMESYANELFIDHKAVFPDIRVEIMAELWNFLKKKPTLEKLEFALRIKNAEAFDRGATPYQDVTAIIDLRNGLIHFNPEWFSEQKKHAKISARLKQGATLSPFFPATEPLFPRGWASHGTVSWVVQSVLNLMLKFEQLAQIEPRMANFKDRFKAL